MKNQIYLLLLALSIAFFTGCKDDDDPEPPTIDKNCRAVFRRKFKSHY